MRRKKYMVPTRKTGNVCAGFGVFGKYDICIPLQ